MIGIDTNVLVRYFAQDDWSQAAIANEFMESLTPEKPGYVTLVVLVELFWVLTRCYAMEAVEVGLIIQMMLSTKSLVIEQSAVVWQGVKRFKAAPSHFVDTLITTLCHAAQCEQTVTFDKQAAKVAGMQLLA